MSDKKASSKSEVTTQVAVYSASILAGLVSMWSSIRYHFHANMKSSTDWFNKINKQRATDLKNIENVTGVEHFKEHFKIHSDHAAATRKIIEERGYTNSWKKFKFLTLHQRVQVVGIAITVATVAVGTMMNIRQGWQNEHMMRQLEDLNRKKDKNTSPGIN